MGLTSISKNNRKCSEKLLSNTCKEKCREAEIGDQERKAASQGQSGGMKHGGGRGDGMGVGQWGSEQSLGDRQKEKEQGTVGG